MNGIRITGTPAEVAAASKAINEAFKGMTLAEVINAINAQQLINTVNNQLKKL